MSLPREGRKDVSKAGVRGGEGTQLFGFCEMGSDELMITKEKPDPDESEHDIDLRA